MMAVKASRSVALAIPFALVQLSLLAAGAARPELAGAYYTGNIGESFPIQMSLSVEGTKASGSYYYMSAGVPLTLNGTASKLRGATLTETDPTSVRTGSFSGPIDFAAPHFNGTWSSPDGRRTLPFNLEKTASYVQVKAKGTQTRGTVIYPVLQKTSTASRKINETIRLAMTEDLAKFMRESASDVKELARGGEPMSGEYFWERSCTIAYAADSLISMTDTTEIFTGGAHGNTSCATSNWWIRDGVAVEIRLDDLFLPDSGWRTKISSACIRELKKKNASNVMNASIRSFKKEDLEAFYITPAGITFVFAPYKVGCFAEGTFEATVAFAELSEQLNPRGPAGKFVR